MAGLATSESEIDSEATARQKKDLPCFSHTLDHVWRTLPTSLYTPTPDCGVSLKHAKTGGCCSRPVRQKRSTDRVVCRFARQLQ